MLRYYISAIIASAAVIFIANILLIPQASALSVLLFLLLAILEAFAVDAIVALVIRYLVPEKHYDPISKRFKVQKFEKKLYSKLGIRKWKDKIPETGGMLVGFQKKKVLDLHDNKYLYKFMQETCYAEAMHEWSVPLGFVVVALCPSPLKVSVALPVALVNAVLQILP
ncbi:MAG: hypothetical protein J6U86_02345, partial [Clostridia bacterium]|nr:hypothetical protein [Clostridia bacterium]